jgi:predicted PurR-regulated permease PerM
MEKKNPQPIVDIKVNPVIHQSLQLLALGLLLVWCFFILSPFITPLVWAAVMATAFYPLHQSLSRRLNNKSGLSATIISVSLLLIIMGPAVWLLLATADEFQILVDQYRHNDLHIPAPNEKVANWPIVGNKIYTLWNEASINLSDTLVNHQNEIKPYLFKFFTLLKSSAKGLLLFSLSIGISGVLLAYAKEGSDLMKTFFTKLAGKEGENMSESAQVTIRNVVKGILGVAIIQTIFAGIGLVVAGIPFAGVWILICLILSIVQIGILPVSLGAIIYIWGSADTLTATIFTIWMIAAGLLDNFLKPILLGKGAPAPMAIVFMVAIGGFLFSGFIGLFTGAIILTLGYKLAVSWLYSQNS